MKQAKRATLAATGFKVLERGIAMDSSTLIRVAAGVLFVIVLVILIQRRRKSVK
jgi:hypothetical protein